MIKSTEARQRAVKAAIGSVRAEGLKPSKQVQRDLHTFAQGKTTIAKVRRTTILRITNAQHSTK